MQAKGANDDRDAIKLIDFCSDEEAALTETETQSVSFKSKKVIEPGLNWDADKVQRIRLHVVMRGQQFLKQEKEK
jgi:hypothetical protein